MKRVLLVDDEDGVRRLIKAVLSAGGFEVIDASNTSDALALAETKHIDVLVTDVLMDDMDGRSLAQAIVRKQPALPVVFISGYEIDIEAERRRHPYCAFVHKPFSAKALVSSINELTGQQSCEQ